MKTFFHRFSAFCFVLLLGTTVFASPAPGDFIESTGSSTQPYLSNDRDTVLQDVSNQLQEIFQSPLFTSTLEVAASQNDLNTVQILLADTRIYSPLNLHKAFMVASAYRSYDTLQYLIVTYHKDLDPSILVEAIEAHHQNLSLNYDVLLQTVGNANNSQAVTRLLGILVPSTLATAVQVSVQANNDITVKLILDNYPGNLPVNFEELLEFAVHAKNYDSLRTILHALEFRYPSTDVSGIPAFSVAAKNNDLEAVKILLGDTRIYSRLNLQKAFMVASAYRSYDTLQYLIVTYHEDLDTSILVEAIEAHHQNLSLNYNVLLQTVVNANNFQAFTRLLGIMDPSTLVTAVQVSVQANNDIIVKLILDNYLGNLPVNFEELLEFAVHAKNYDSLRTILHTREFRDPSTDVSGIPALSVAAKNNDLEAVKILLGDSHIFSAQTVTHTFLMALQARSYDVLRYVFTIDGKFQNPMTYVTALFGSIQMQDNVAVQMILNEYPGDLTMVYQDLYQNLLTSAVLCNNYESLVFILECSRFRNEIMPTRALEAAASTNNVVAIKALLEKTKFTSPLDNLLSSAVQGQAKQAIQYFLTKFPSIFFNPLIYVNAIHEVILQHIDFPLSEWISKAGPSFDYELFLVNAINAKNYKAMHIILQSNRLSTLERAIAAADLKSDMDAMQILFQYYNPSQIF